MAKTLFVIAYLMVGLGYNESIMTYHPLASESSSNQIGRVIAWPIGVGFDIGKHQVENGVYTTGE